MGWDSRTRKEVLNKEDSSRKAHFDASGRCFGPGRRPGQEQRVAWRSTASSRWTSLPVYGGREYWHSRTGTEREFSVRNTGPKEDVTESGTMANRIRQASSVQHYYVVRPGLGTIDGAREFWVDGGGLE